MTDRVCELASQVQHERGGKGAALIERKALIAGLKAMVPALECISAEGQNLGLDPQVISHLQPGILARASELKALS